MIFIVLALAALLAVIGYNMYQENQYRKQVREQFGHSDKDALLTSKTKHVRDSKETGGQGLFIKKNKKQLKLDYFRLQCDLLENLNGIPCNFFLCLTDITKIDKMLSIYGRFVFIDEISDKTLFEEGVLYHIGKK